MVLVAPEAEKIEQRPGVEFRVLGSTLTGIAMRYGDVSQEFRERFAPGAFTPLGEVAMLLQHDPALVILGAGGFSLIDTPTALEVRAELSPDSAALKLVKRGALSSWSVGFLAIEERQENGLRVIERAELREISLVDQGSYPDAKAEVRAATPQKFRFWR